MADNITTRKDKDAVKSADKAVILLYTKPTDENKKWFDGIYGKGASDIILEYIDKGDIPDKLYNQPSTMKLWQALGPDGVDAMVKFAELNTGREKVPGFNAPGSALPEDNPGFYNDPGAKPSVIPGFNAASPKNVAGFNKPRKYKPKGFYEDAKPRKPIPGFDVQKKDDE